MGRAELYSLPQAHRYALVTAELRGPSLNRFGRLARAHATVGNFARRTRPEGDKFVFSFRVSRDLEARVPASFCRDSSVSAYDVHILPISTESGVEKADNSKML